MDSFRLIGCFRARLLSLLAAFLLSMQVCSAGDTLGFPVVNTWVKGNAVAGVPSFRVCETMVNVGSMYVPGQTLPAFASVMFGGEGAGANPGSVLFHNDTWLLSRRGDEPPWWSPCVSSTSSLVPAGRILHTMVSLGNGSVLVYGGFGYPETQELFWPAMGDLWKLDAESCTWTDLTATRANGDAWPGPRAGHSAVMMGTDGMVVFGGCASLVRGHDRPLCRNNTDEYNDVWVFNTTTLQWTQQTTWGASMPRARYNHLAVTLSGAMFVAAGQDDTWGDRHNRPPHERDNDVYEQDDDDDAANKDVFMFHLKEVWRLDLTTWMWAQQPDGPTDKFGLSVTLSGKGAMTSFTQDSAILMAVPFDQQDQIALWVLHGSNGTFSLRYTAPSWTTIPTLQSVYAGGFSVVADERQNNTFLVVGYFQGSDEAAASTANTYLSLWETFLSSQGVMWQAVRSLNTPPPRYGHCAALVGDNLYVYGGASSARELYDTFLNDMWSLEGAKELFERPPTWRRVLGTPFVPRARVYHECFAFSNESMVMIGGRQASCDMSFTRFQMFAFDTIWAEWQPIQFRMTDASMPEPPPQYFMFASSLSNVYSYNPHESNSTSTLGPFILINGGQSAPCFAPTFDPSNSTWLVNMTDFNNEVGDAVVTFIPSSPSPPRYGHTMITMGGPKMKNTFFLIFGGNSVEGRLNDVWTLTLNVTNVESSQWVNMTCLRGKGRPEARSSHLAKSIGPYKMLIAGGESSSAITLNDVWMFEYDVNTGCGNWYEMQTYQFDPYFFSMAAAVSWESFNDFPIHPNNAYVLLFGGRQSKHEITADLAVYAPGCNAGYWTTDMWHYPCEPCEKGFYQFLIGSADCLACPPGVTTPDVGSTTSSNCTKCKDRFCQHGGVCSVFVDADNNHSPICTSCDFGYAGNQCDRANALFIFIFVVVSGIFILIVCVGGFFLIKKLTYNSKEKGRAETALRLYDRTELVDQGSLGTGSFGKVIKCRCLRTETFVAVKEMQHTGSLVSFVREITTSGDVKSKQHKNVVKLLGYGWLLTERPDANSLFLVFEFLDCTLRDYLRDQGAVDVSTIRQIAGDVAAGMDHFHTVLRVLHRDLKSSNILLKIDPSGAILGAKVADMGLAVPIKSVTHAGSRAESADGGYSAQGTFGIRKLLGLGRRREVDDEESAPLLAPEKGNSVNSAVVSPSSPRAIPARPGVSPLPLWQPPPPPPTLASAQSSHAPTPVSMQDVNLFVHAPPPLEQSQQAQVQQLLLLHQQQQQQQQQQQLQQQQQKSSSKSGTRTIEAPFEPFPDSSVWTDSPQEESKRVCVGTVGWQAPELLIHGTATKASDVYSYGVVLWEMMTLASPFADQVLPTLHGEDRKAAIAAIVKAGGTPTYPLLAVNACMHPGWLVQLMRDCWAFEQEDRPSFKEVLTAIQQASPSSFFGLWKKNKHL